MKNQRKEMSSGRENGAVAAIIRSGSKRILSVDTITQLLKVENEENYNHHGVYYNEMVMTFLTMRGLSASARVT